MGTRQRTGQSSLSLRPIRLIKNHFWAHSLTHSHCCPSSGWWGQDKDILAGQNEWLLVSSSSSNSRRTSPTKHSIYHLVISFCRAQWGSRPEPEPPWSWQWWCSTMIPRSCILFWEEPNRDCDQVQAHQDHSGLWTTWINLSASFWWMDGDNPCDTFYSSCACRLSLLPNW